MRKIRRNYWRWRLAAGLLTIGAAAPAALAEGAGGAVPAHACFANDSIVMGKRLAPNPAVVESRLKSAACQQALLSADTQGEDAASVQQALERIDRTLTGLLRNGAN
jgi:hypothetical protein